MVAKAAKVKKKDRIVLIEGDKHFDRISNYITADINNYQTPEHVVQNELNEMLEKIKTLTGANSLIKNGVLNLVLKEKIEAYTDASKSLIKLTQFMNTFSNKMEIEK